LTTVGSSSVSNKPDRFPDGPVRRKSGAPAPFSRMTPGMRTRSSQTAKPSISASSG
jgi:hypothetical protein